MLDRLSKCFDPLITRQAEVHVRDADVDRGSRSHLVDLHNQVRNRVPGLLVEPRHCHPAMASLQLPR